MIGENSEAVFDNAAALRSKTTHWIGDSLKWSPKCGGCLMWTRGGQDWSSQDEGMYETPDSAADALVWYEDRGVNVDIDSLEDCSVADRGRP